MATEEKSYNKALIKAAELIDKMRGKNCNAIEEDILNIFPELKESEGERMKQAILGFLEGSGIDREIIPGIKIKDALAWLEKQGNKETLCDKCKKEQPSHSCQDITALGRCAVEHEQKTADKVEPKFKIGDWVVNNDSGVIQHIKEIVNVNDETLYVFDEDSVLDINFQEQYHLWTIQDAKDGDILSNGKMIVIFKHFEEPSYRQHIVAYIGLDNNGDIQITNGTWNLGIDKAKPATKEQRDLLFQKIGETIYEWDADKKKLKKVENEIEIPLGAKDSELQEAIYYIPQGFHAEIDDDKVVIKKGEKPAEWSEEDKNMIRYIGNAITCEESAKYLEEKGVDIIEAHCWLESLKPQPKQEWKQENTDDLTDFENAMMHIGGSFFGQYAGLDPNDTNEIKKQAKFLLEFVPKQEWSEEDEKMIRGLIVICDEWTTRHSFYSIENCEVEKLKKWLKSLRPQKQWKPSEEQMKVLVWCKPLFADPKSKDILGSLINDLKKLTE